MAFKRPVITVLALALVTSLVPALGTAQEEQAPVPVYLEVHCMLSTSADYADVEMAIWQPMHQEAIKQGKKLGWSLYWVLYGDRSDCDYYTVDSYLGLEQLNEDRDYEGYFAKAHPGKSWDEANAKTAASRTMVRSELWVWLDGVPPAEHQFAVVNRMHAEDAAPYLEHEREIWKPVHEALVEGGHTAGWGLYQLLSPAGSSVSYNFGTVDFLKRLGPAPVEQAMASAHPEADAATILQRAEDVRDHLLAQTWVLVASTN